LAFTESSRSAHECSLIRLYTLAWLNLIHFQFDMIMDFSESGSQSSQFKKFNMLKNNVHFHKVTELLTTEAH
jgi:hypothetical protein